MEKLKYPENVDYVMGKYGEQIKQAFIEQNEIVRQIKRSEIHTDETMDAFMEVAINCAKELHLNVYLTEIIAQNYIREKEFSGNDTELLLGSIKRNLGIGAYCYDALTPKDQVYLDSLKKKILSNVKYEPKDKEMIENAIDVIIDGILSLKLSVSKEGVEEKSFLSQEAQLVKLCESIYIIYELFGGLKDGSIQKLHEWYNETLIDMGILENLRRVLINGQKLTDVDYYNLTVTFKRRIYNNIVETSRATGKIGMSDPFASFLGQIKGIVDNSYDRKQKRQRIKAKVPKIKELIEVYANFLAEDDNYYIKSVLSGKELADRILVSFEESQLSELLQFISYYSYEDFLSIQKQLKASMYKMAVREWERVEGVCKGRNKSDAIEHIGRLVNPNSVRYSRYKNYAEQYLDFKKDTNKKIKLIVPQTEKAIAYEFAIRFLSTKSPEQLLEIVKRFEEYERSFENTTRKSGGIEI